MCCPPLPNLGEEDAAAHGFVVEFRGAREEDIARFPAFVFKKAQVDQLPLHGKEEDDLKVMPTLGVDLIDRPGAGRDALFLLKGILRCPWEVQSALLLRLCFAHCVFGCPPCSLRAADRSCSSV
jgi:hypothetical protein